MMILAITEGAKKMLELDPHGWILAAVAVSVVFLCLLILFGLYSLSGYLFTRAGKSKPAEAPEDDLQQAACIAVALYLKENESSVSPIANEPTAWGARQRTFRKLPGKFIKL